MSQKFELHYELTIWAAREPYRLKFKPRFSLVESSSSSIFLARWIRVRTRTYLLLSRTRRDKCKTRLDLIRLRPWLTYAAPVLHVLFPDPNRKTRNRCPIVFILTCPVTSELCEVIYGRALSALLWIKISTITGIHTIQ